jgi:hypothetical protein
MWDLWWTKRHWGRFSPSTLVSLGKHSIDCSTLIIIQGWYNRPVLASVIVDSVPLQVYFYFYLFIAFFTMYSRYLKRVISKRDGCEYLKQVPSIDGSLELI